MTEDTYALLEGTYDIHTNFTYSFQDPGYVNKARAEQLKHEMEENKGLAEVIARLPGAAAKAKKPSARPAKPKRAPAKTPKVKARGKKASQRTAGPR